MPQVIMKICRDSNVLDGLAVSDVEPKFGRRSYEDLLVKTQSFTTLMSANVPPIQAYKYSRMSKDPESDALAFEAYREERKNEEEDSIQRQIDEERKRIANESNNGEESTGAVQTI